MDVQIESGPARRVSGECLGHLAAGGVVRAQDQDADHAAILTGRSASVDHGGIGRQQLTEQVAADRVEPLTLQPAGAVPVALLTRPTAFRAAVLLRHPMNCGSGRTK
ncbi:hypothetical protein GCM10017781_20920 [Deinococcus metalli]|uniref:Uncharacterized protein n=1 Tax=Deinococcus metalli TaxID=1141878 RepID=A0ABQ3JMX7_9DEIO|nr:hypothetical protein GCM10017781_20920 [Deinococcus metalli]